VARSRDEKRNQPRPETRPWLTGALLTIMLGAFVLAPNPEALAWSAHALVDREPWRLLTGHWVHADAAHLAWNSIALVVLGSLIERHDRRLLVGSLAAGHLAVNGWLLTVNTGLSFYCGLSGVLHALLVTALVLEWRHGSRPVALLAGVLCLAKLGTELLTGGAVITQTLWPAVPPAHAAGVLGGALLALALALPARLRAGSASRPTAPGQRYRAVRRL
jgi:rhomboid family GlyGly-CTERM serine protease